MTPVEEDPPRTLVVTLAVPEGGVVTLTRQIVGFLKEAGHEVGLAQPGDPWRPGGGTDGSCRSKGGDASGIPEPWRDLGLVEHHEVPSHVPLVEWGRYVPTPSWRRVLERYDRHIVTTGSLLLSGPLIGCGLPHLAWVATGFWADRRDRFRSWPVWRKAADLVVNAAPGLLAERILARHPKLLLAVISEYTASHFARWRSPPQILPVGVEVERFCPDRAEDGGTGATSSGTSGGASRPPDRPLRVGFAGRLSDPRKNLPLLAETLRACAERGLRVELALAGGEPGVPFRREAERLGVVDRIDQRGRLPDDEMPAFYRGLDVFLIPSRQEGLGIVGLEAMAAGCPVVSTACGGPEDYVVPGETGYLVNASAGAMADAIERLVRDEAHRLELARGARRLVEERYSMDVVRREFWRLYEEVSWEAAG